MVCTLCSQCGQCRTNRARHRGVNFDGLHAPACTTAAPPNPAESVAIRRAFPRLPGADSRESNEPAIGATQIVPAPQIARFSLARDGCAAQSPRIVGLRRSLVMSRLSAAHRPVRFTRILHRSPRRWPASVLPRGQDALSNGRSSRLCSRPTISTQTECSLRAIAFALITRPPSQSLRSSTSVN